MSNIDNKNEKNNDTIEIKSYVKVNADPKASTKKSKLTTKPKTVVREMPVKETANKETVKKVADKKVVDKKVDVKKEDVKKEDVKKEVVKTEVVKKDVVKKEAVKKVSANPEAVKKETDKKETVKKSVAPKEEVKKEEVKKDDVKKENVKSEIIKKDIIDKLPKGLALDTFKVALPIVACVIVIAAIISFIVTRNNNENSDSDTATEASFVLSDTPLEENAHEDVNTLMNRFYNALASGDTDTIREVRDYNDDTEILQYEKKSDYIESYDDIVCYTKPGLDDSSYFVYVSYNAKFVDIETKAPGLNAFFVYTNDDGNLIIDGNMEDDVAAAFKLVTNQEDVVDLYNRVDVSYKEAVSADSDLDSMASELPLQIKTAVGEELAQIYAQSAETQTEESNDTSGTESSANDTTDITENQSVDQVVKTTDTVNVRSSDSETADKIGKAAVGTELRRTEIKVNGWSKVIFEGNEAYIKSDYLELVSSNDVIDGATTDNNTAATVSGNVKALTNVNVRQEANQNSAKLGTAVAGQTYELLGVEGEWYKISFNGSTGYGKAEYFEEQ